MDALDNRLTPEQSTELMATLQQRFESNTGRHAGLNWPDVQAKLESMPEKLWSLWCMEQSAGEPDVVGVSKDSGEYLFFDCSPESPVQRRNLCYDGDALASRKQNKPENSAVEVARTMGITLLTQDQYCHLQELGTFDAKTSSWIATPPDIRKLGGALFADRRFNHVFVYHNTAESYYSSRGFRGALSL